MASRLPLPQMLLTFWIRCSTLTSADTSAYDAIIFGASAPTRIPSLVLKTTSFGTPVYSRRFSTFPALRQIQTMGKSVSSHAVRTCLLRIDVGLSFLRRRDGRHPSTLLRSPAQHQDNTEIRSALARTACPVTLTRVSVFLVRIISGGVGEFIGPGMDDGMAIDAVDSGHDALLESYFDVTRM